MNPVVVIWRTALFRKIVPRVKSDYSNLFNVLMLAFEV